MSLLASIASDAKAMIDADGEDITYTPDGGAPVVIKCYPNTEPLQTRGTDENRSLSYKMALVISKADIPVVTLNKDTVTVPGAWVNQAGTPTLRVAVVLGDRTDPGTWNLGVR